MRDNREDKLGIPAVVDRNTFQTALDALRTREELTQERTTPLRPPAGGCPWSRSMPRRHLSANVAH